MPREPRRASSVANEPSVADEITLTDLPVSGTLPGALSGQYLCIGPERIDARTVPGDGVTGYGMAHAVTLHAGGAVSYRNRRTATCAAADVGATSLVAVGRSIYVVGDGELACGVSRDLDTIGPVDLGGAHRCLAAHPTIDPGTGELHLLTYATDPSQLLVRVSPGGLTRTIRSIGNTPSRVRELALTDDNVLLLADGYVGVIGRRAASTAATWFEADTDALHLATADVDGESVVVWATGESLVRWVLHPQAGVVDCEALDVTPQASAGTNRHLPGNPRRCLWTVGARSAHQHNLVTGARRSHEFAAGRRPEALVFIPDPGPSTTDDGGWLVGFVHDESTNETDFVVLDAQAIERDPTATVHIPRRVTAVADATWIPELQI